MNHVDLIDCDLFRLSGERFVEVVRQGVEENILAMNERELSK